MTIFRILRCWHCDYSPVTIRKDGWLCVRCGQSGEDSILAKTKEEGAKKNRPYLEITDAVL